MQTTVCRPLRIFSRGQGAAKSLPVGRTGVADDIAQAVEMPIDNTFATGVLLDVDGGARSPL